MLEAVLRNVDGVKVTEENVRQLAAWKPNADRPVFGDPDATNDQRWTYKGLRIQDPTDNKMYDTVIFSFKKGKVAEIYIE